MPIGFQWAFNLWWVNFFSKRGQQSAAESPYNMVEYNMILHEAEQWRM